MNPDFWRNKNVLVTGHTGFKGSWLSLWLQNLGANVTGYSVDVPSRPSMFESAKIGENMRSVTADIRDLPSLQACMKESKPEIVIHMAAQSLVRRSYKNPVETYGTNVMGTVKVLEAVRHSDGIRVLINVTSDKCYDNQERQRGYTEDEPMGGHDPYSSSKGCSELVTSAYRDSYFNIADHADHGVAVASARAGNVIGGGDWAEDRLIPDAIRAFSDGIPVEVRNPDAIRPWQFVLDHLNGYLTLAENLYADGPAFAGAWNFGPDESDARNVGWVVDQLANGWGDNAEWRCDRDDHPHEAMFLKLDSSKAKTKLSWHQVQTLAKSLEWTIDWYRCFYSQGDAIRITNEQIAGFQAEATQ